MQCLNCGKKIPNTAKVCRYCEAVAEPEPTEEEKNAVLELLGQMPPEALEELGAVLDGVLADCLTLRIKPKARFLLLERAASIVRYESHGDFPRRLQGLIERSSRVIDVYADFRRTMLSVTVSGLERYGTETRPWVADLGSWIMRENPIMGRFHDANSNQAAGTNCVLVKGGPLMVFPYWIGRYAPLLPGKRIGPSMPDWPLGLALAVEVVPLRNPIVLRWEHVFDRGGKRLQDCHHTLGVLPILP